MSGDKATGQAEVESRGRSTINFPYFDQDGAFEVAMAVHAVGGTSCEWNQLAAQMKQAPQGGGFRLRMMAAKAFGLLTYDRGSVSLTDLGIRAVDPKFQRAARADSFLEVELFKAMYEKFKNSMLPPMAAIERAMETAGVAPKQKDKARQVFIRSAKQAGYFELDQNRLTYPPLRGEGARDEKAKSGDNEHSKGSGAAAAAGAGAGGAGAGAGGGGEGYHPFIKGLLDKLPAPESKWQMSSRAKWLQTAANIFDLMYKPEDQDGDKTINVSIEGEGSAP
jgi:hypothetical protein